ncbi:MAG: hypothetical protein AAB605_04300 [Patescibacteria group bacterium]
MVPYYKFFEHDFLPALGGKKNLELWAAYHFLANDGVNPINRDAFNAAPAEPADVVYNNRKFQITTGSQDQDAVINILAKSTIAQKGNTRGSWHELSTGQKVRMYETTRNLYEGLDSDILRPIRNKIDQYGRNNNALNDVTLVIFSFSVPVDLHEETLWRSFLEQNESLFDSSGFKEIYWADQKSNIPVWKRSN